MAETDLDPSDWPQFERTYASVTSEVTSFVRRVGDRPVWQRPGDEVRSYFRGEPPLDPTCLADLWEELKPRLLPHLTGNLHPRFFGWAHGAGTPAGALAEAIAGFLNANLAGRDQAPVLMERQVVDWFRTLFGFPASATGALVSGTSIGNLVALNVARDVKSSYRRDPRSARLPRVYMSEGSHLSARRALRVLGLPDETLVLVGSDPAGRLDPTALRCSIQSDRDRGRDPIAVVATAGTAGTGAIDPMAEVAEICSGQDLWFHVDGAFGALSHLSPNPPASVAGLDRADSLAFDFHKWVQVPYSAGCVLIRDGEAHLATFRTTTPYTDVAAGELGGGRPWPTDLGPEMSRGFRALKVWFTIKHFGLRRLIGQMDQSREQARALGEMVTADPRLELSAPVTLNVVCLRYVGDGSASSADDRLQELVVERLQSRGVASPSATRVDGESCIRIAVFNHRTRTRDLHEVLGRIKEIGRAIESEDSCS